MYSVVQCPIHRSLLRAHHDEQNLIFSKKLESQMRFHLRPVHPWTLLRIPYTRTLHKYKTRIVCMQVKTRLIRDGFIL